MKIILFFLISLLSFQSFTQTAKQIGPNKQSPTVWEIEKKNILSPLTTPAAYILIGGSSISYLMYRDLKDRGEFGYDPNHREAEPGDWEYYGDLAGWGMFQMGYTLLQLPAIYRGDKKSLKDTEMMWKSTLYTSLTTLVLKLSVTEQRRNNRHKFESFPSGHASAAFAFATNIALRHEWYWNFVSVPLALWATFSRTETDAHYYHDSVFGAALGISFAYGMNYISEDTPFLLSYIPKDDGGGIGIQYEF